MRVDIFCTHVGPLSARGITVLSFVAELVHKIAYVLMATSSWVMHNIADFKTKPATTLYIKVCKTQWQIHPFTYQYNKCSSHFGSW